MKEEKNYILFPEKYVYCLKELSHNLIEKRYLGGLREFKS